MRLNVLHLARTASFGPNASQKGILALLQTPQPSGSSKRLCGLNVAGTRVLTAHDRKAMLHRNAMNAILPFRARNC